MSSNKKLYEKNHNSMKDLSKGEGSFNRVSSEGFSWGPFVYGPSGAGLSIYAPAAAMAIILLEPIRNLRWRNGDGEEVTSSCVAGTVLIVPAQQGITITWPTSVEILKVFTQVDEVVEQHGLEAAFPVSNPPSRIINFSSKQCLQVGFLILERLREKTAKSDRYLESLYYVIVDLIARNAVIACSLKFSQPGLSSYACRQIENYLKENFRNTVTVPDMATLLGMSAGHFSLCFRESFGLAPHQYLMGLRLEKAEKWLLETDMPISEIAARLSFSSQSHLTTALKKHSHLTPGELRRRGNQPNFRKTKS